MSTVGHPIHYTDDQIRDMRRRHAAYVIAHPGARATLAAALAAEYGCSLDNMHKILRRYSYRDVPQGVPV